MIKKLVCISFVILALTFNTYCLAYQDCNPNPNSIISGVPYCDDIEKETIETKKGNEINNAFYPNSNTNINYPAIINVNPSQYMPNNYTQPGMNIPNNNQPPVNSYNYQNQMPDNYNQPPMNMPGNYQPPVNSYNYQNQMPDNYNLPQTNMPDNYQPPVNSYNYQNQMPDNYNLPQMNIPNNYQPPINSYNYQNQPSINNGYQYVPNTPQDLLPLEIPGQ